MKIIRLVGNVLICSLLLLVLSGCNKENVSRESISENHNILDHKFNAQSWILGKYKLNKDDFEATFKQSSATISFLLNENNDKLVIKIANEKSLFNSFKNSSWKNDGKNPSSSIIQLYYAKDGSLSDNIESSYIWTVKDGINSLEIDLLQKEKPNARYKIIFNSDKQKPDNLNAKIESFNENGEIVNIRSYKNIKKK